MTRLPIINFITMEKMLISIGFKKMRQRGAHVFYKHPDGRTTTVPNHPGRDLARPLTHEILREIELSHDEFIKHLK
jgi:predicted RNA binding protein YcfA (HicA-like mRNA interferase family)